MGLRAADKQDIRPLRIALLNLMPKKTPDAERRNSRCLIGALALAGRVQPDPHDRSRDPHTSAAEHMGAFYLPLRRRSPKAGEKFDGLIITGAHHRTSALHRGDLLGRADPCGFDWTQTHVHSTFGVCWGRHARCTPLQAFFITGVEKHMLAAKAFFRLFPPRRVAEPALAPNLRGFSDEFVIPVSRWTEVRQTEIDTVPGLQTLLTSAEVGPCLIEDRAHRALYIFNHFEYDSDTLKQEYDRDVANGTSDQRAPQLLSRG